MSLNKFMHPRNIYRSPPNFKELAILYPDFRKHAKQDISGKVSINFQDHETLRALTTALLRKDFGLEVQIPSDRLVPTLPLRLNYLLWIEDLLAFSDENCEKSIRGIDIGTGASCIYPLLAAKKNGWYMVASETDRASAEAAKVNVENNNLQELIKVQLVEQDKIIIPLVGKEEKYDFCMCNPPFFKNEDELDQKKKSRTAERPPPRNAWTGSVDEVVTPGGEIGLISKIMEESLQLGNSIRIYTTMVGVKSDLRPLKEELLRSGITNTATTEFCQGRTTRWGLAWSFSDQPNLNDVCSKHTHKKIKPMSYVVPHTNVADSYSVESICEKVKELLGTLQVQYNELKHSSNARAMTISAAQNTWTHQRRLRRKMQKNRKRSDDVAERQSDEVEERQCEEVAERQSDEVASPAIGVFSGSHLHLKESEAVSNITGVMKTSNETEETSLSRLGSKVQSEVELQLQSQKRELEGCSADQQPSVKKIRTDKLLDSVTEKGESGVIQSDQKVEASDSSPVLNATLIVRKETDDILIEMTYIDGSSGKDGVHQVLQYIRNHLKC